jgi:ATP-dependent protease ClpP protease subunit
LYVPNPDYRLNPARAIYISGPIGPEMVTDLTPQILRLQHTSRAPISVYIDSPGGIVASMESILRLLRMTDQDSSSPCRIITAVANRAASAAADLLSSGDYAIAFPSSSVLYHGIRRYEQDPLTLESTASLASLLRFGNDYYAMELARKTAGRFSFMYAWLRGEFPDVRARNQDPTLSDLDCFVITIGEKLSENAKEVWKKAAARKKMYESLFSTLLKKVRRKIDSATVAELDADAIKAIVDFELKRNKHTPDWGFRTAGIGQVAEDFFLLQEYMSTHNSDHLRAWCKLWGRWLLTEEQVAKIEKMSGDEQKERAFSDASQPILRPLWSFFVALCHALQEGENELTPADAYWFGLVDEVMGRSDMAPVRLVAEYRDNVVPDTI